jgi:hypothetical protein
MHAMPEAAEFVVQRSGRIEVMLGAHLVGVIEPWAFGGGRRFGEVRAHYRMLLGEGRASPRGASSVGVARRQLLHRLAEWFDAAGPLFAPAAEALAAQAELEREAA